MPHLASLAPQEQSGLMPSLDSGTGESWTRENRDTSIELRSASLPTGPPQENMEVHMRLLRPGRRGAALGGVLAGAAMALGLLTVTAVAATPATAATSSSSLIKPDMAANSSYNHLSKAAQGALISSPLGLHTAGMSAQACSTSTKNWFHIGINYDQAGGYTHDCFWWKRHVVLHIQYDRLDLGRQQPRHLRLVPASGGQSGYTFLTGWSRDWPALTDADYVTINGWSGTSAASNPAKWPR